MRNPFSHASNCTVHVRAHILLSVYTHHVGYETTSVVLLLFSIKNMVYLFPFSIQHFLRTFLFGCAAVQADPSVRSISTHFLTFSPSYISFPPLAGQINSSEETILPLPRIS